MIHLPSSELSPNAFAVLDWRAGHEEVVVHPLIYHLCFIMTFFLNHMQRFTLRNGAHLALRLWIAHPNWVLLKPMLGHKMVLVNFIGQVRVTKLRIVEVDICVHRIPNCVNALFKRRVQTFGLHRLNFQRLHELCHRNGSYTLVLSMGNLLLLMGAASSAILGDTPFSAAFHRGQSLD